MKKILTLKSDVDQLSLLKNNKPDSIIAEKYQNWYLYTDGASRGNPGHSAIGIYLFKEVPSIEKEEELSVEKLGFYIGIKTNNQAEYFALLIGLMVAKKYFTNKDILNIRLDSELIVKQIKGQYKVKNLNLRLIFQDVLKLLPINYTIEHVKRSDNSIADELANLGLDKKIKNTNIIEIVKKYEQN